MAITFSVDEVEVQGERYPVVPLQDSLPGRRERALRASAGPDKVVQLPSRNAHPLAYAVHLAFSKHRPLVLSPDAIWMAIAQGFSVHVNAHAEGLRERFVKHRGKKKLIIVHNDDDVDRAWPDLIPQFVARIREHVGPGVHRLLINDFSTTGDLERTASEIGMMETFVPYFEYEVGCICGIPTITLTGTVEDWKTIRRRLDVIAEYGLHDWIRLLAPVADQWVMTAQGHPDRHFWQSIYKPEEAYAVTEVTGWLLRLFPYLWSDRKPVPNTALYKTSSKEWHHEGVSVGKLGRGLSVAPVKINHSDGSTEQVRLLGGFIGVTQESGSLALEPKLGWCVLDGEAFRRGPGDSVRKQYLKFLKSTSKARSLFDGAWTLRGSGELGAVTPDPLEYRSSQHPWITLTIFADLPDGRWLAWYEDGDYDRVCFVPGKIRASPSLDSPVIAEDLPVLFDRARREGPFFFDSKSFRAEKTLRDFLGLSE